MHLICCLVYTILSSLTPKSSAVHFFDQSCVVVNEFWKTLFGVIILFGVIWDLTHFANNAC